MIQNQISEIYKNFFLQGSFSKADFIFKVYYPSSRQIEDSQIPEDWWSSIGKSVAEFSLFDLKSMWIVSLLKICFNCVCNTENNLK